MYKKALSVAFFTVVVAVGTLVTAITIATPVHAVARCLGEQDTRSCPSDEIRSTSECDTKARPSCNSPQPR